MEFLKFTLPGSEKHASRAELLEKIKKMKEKIEEEKAEIAKLDAMKLTVQYWARVKIPPTLLKEMAERCVLIDTFANTTTKARGKNKKKKARGKNKARVLEQQQKDEQEQQPE